MSLDRQPAVRAEWRRLALTIHAIRPIRTTAPSRIHSHSSLVAVPEAGVADADGVAVVTVGVAVTVVVDVDGAGVVGAAVVGGAVVGGAVVGGAVVGGAVGLSGTVGPLVAVVAWLVRWLIALLTVLPQPTTRKAATRMAADRERLFAGCRMPILPSCSPDQSTAVMIPLAGRADLIR
jgi:hypothetical protein